MPVTDPKAKPYKFIPLHPDGKELKQITGHEQWRNLTGTLSCTIKALTPLHIGSGLIVAVSELRARQDIEWPANFMEALALEHYRINGKRTIPATSLKGCFRSAIEAITRSCVSKSKARESSGRNSDDKSSFENSHECRVKSGRPLRLCPACSLFGAMGFEGKVRFSDAQQVIGNGAIAFRPAPNQPNRDFSEDHPIHRDKYFQRVTGGRWQVRGRKFYPHFGQPKDQIVKYEPVEVCSKDSLFDFKIGFESLPEDHLGLLLLALGQGEGLKVYKIGGSKPFGYGAVEIISCTGVVWDDKALKERCLSWELESNAQLDWDTLCDRALEKAKADELVLNDQLQTLKQFLNTTPQYSVEDVARWQKGEDKYE